MTSVGIDGPQWVLEYWSDINNVFQFVRVEDIAYDKTHDNIVYIVDSEGAGLRHSTLRARIRRSHRRTAASGRWCSSADIAPRS